MQKQKQIEIYQANDGSTQIEVHFEQESVWLTQAQMAELFETTPQNITMQYVQRRSFNGLSPFANWMLDTYSDAGLYYWYKYSVDLEK